MVSTNFLAQKTIEKKNIFSNFQFQEMSLKREIFVHFLPQKFITKYGIVSTYSVTFVFQKILACLQCDNAIRFLVNSGHLRKVEMLITSSGTSTE